MKTMFITGSTDGVGKLTATKLAHSGHQLLLHGRNLEKLNHTISEIKLQTNNDKINGFVSDLSNSDSIKNMITEISNQFSSIDVLINNAGVFKSPQNKNEQGLDMRFAVNYFAPYILTMGLIPLLNNSKFARVLNLSSAAQSSVSIEALKGKETVSSQEAYAQSKLALTMWSFAFSKTHPNLTTIAVNPGSLLNTNMVKEAYGHHWSSADKGADILVDLATLASYAKSNGTYFDNDLGVFADAHSDAYNSYKIDQLISETNTILNDEK